MLQVSIFLDRLPFLPICKQFIFMPPFEKGGHIALHMSVRPSVGRYVCLP